MTPTESLYAQTRLAGQFPTASRALIRAAVADAARVAEWAAMTVVVGEVEELARRCLQLRSAMA